MLRSLMKLLRLARIPLKTLERQGQQVVDRGIGAGAVFVRSRERLRFHIRLFVRVRNHLARADVVLAATMQLRASHGQEYWMCDEKQLV